jgi:SAM-dependent methyltransferase
MSRNDEHYRRVVDHAGATRLFRCGYADRFDPFNEGASGPDRTVYRDLFRTFAAGRPFVRLLDIGCGTGIYFEALSPFAERVDAIDCAPEMIDVARRFCAARGLTQFNCLEASARKLPFPEDAFDGVIAMDVLHHVDAMEPVLEEVRRVTKAGGRFLVLEPNVCNPVMALAHALPREERGALGRCRPRTLRALLERGFDTEHWQGVCAFITGASGWKRALLDGYLGMCRRLAPETLYPRQAWIGVKKA